MPFARGAKCLLIKQVRNSRAGSSRNIGQAVRSPEVRVVEIDRAVIDEILMARQLGRRGRVHYNRKPH